MGADFKQRQTTFCTTPTQQEPRPTKKREGGPNLTEEGHVAALDLDGVHLQLPGRGVAADEFGGGDQGRAPFQTIPGLSSK